MTQHWNPATQQVHAGYEPVPGTARPLVPPVVTAAAFTFSDHAEAVDAFGLHRPAFTYARTGSPSLAVLESRLAALEGGSGAVVTASGQSALAIALLALLQGPRHLVASTRLYGGTVDLLTDTFADFGISVDFADPLDLPAWEAALRPDTAAFLVESVTNPLAGVIDLPPLARLAHAHGVAVVVDNTLATPWAYRPLAAGADVVVHSLTKGLGGHGAALGGAVIAGELDVSDPVRFPLTGAPRARYGGESLVQRYGAGAYLALVRTRYLHDLGPCLPAASAERLAQGIESLSARSEQVQRTVVGLVGAVRDHPAVAAVHHTSLPSHPQHRLAARDFPRGTGCVFGLELVDPELVTPVIQGLRLIQLAANIGDTRTLVAHPASMTHCRLSPEQAEAAGVTPALLRLSVGLEDAVDLGADLVGALDDAWRAWSGSGAKDGGVPADADSTDAAVAAPRTVTGASATHGTQPGTAASGTVGTRPEEVLL